MTRRPAVIELSAAELLPWDVVGEGRVVSSPGTDGQIVHATLVTPVLGSPTAVEDGRLRDYRSVDAELRTYRCDEQLRVLRALGGWMWFQESETCPYRDGAVWLGDYAVHLPSEPGSTRCVCAHEQAEHKPCDHPKTCCVLRYAHCSVCGCIDFASRDWKARAD